MASTFSLSRLDLSDDEVTKLSPTSPSPFWRTTNLAASTRPSSATTASSKNPAASGAVGLSDPILSELRRKRLDTINRLHNIGSQREIDLPSIVVIGSQSAGKSSLIESISGINLPRASGTCTRCPMECRLSRTNISEPWQCNVSLRFLNDDHGRPLDVARNTLFGPTIKNPKEVEERLRRAQLAVLNPSVNPQLFLDDTHQKTPNSLNFSNNTVCLEIKGPEVTDLSFCDLPGLIASVADGGRDEEVDEVRELVATYIQNPSCIILLTIACEVDFETQGAYRLAKRYDPEGTRTIGVLTKPDRIPEGEHSRWFKLIRNESSALQNGWFCVKQLSSAELEKAYSFDDAQRFCEKFFKRDPWNMLDSLSQKRLGTKAVITKLNEFLMGVISKRIPEIMQELQDRIQDTRDQLQKLPAPPSSDAVLEVMHLINEFCDSLHSHSRGFYTGDDHGADSPCSVSVNQFEAIREEHADFRMAIQNTEPRFKPHVRPAKLPEVASGDESSSMNSTYLDDISGMIARAVTRELPGYSPFRVVQDLITLSTEKWRVPAFNVMNDVFSIITHHHMQDIEHHFGKYTAGGLHQTVKTLVSRYMQDRKENLEKQLKWLLKLESHAFTINDSQFLTYEREYSQKRVDEILPDSGEDKTALMVMTTVEAYFQVAYKRFIDNVCLAIDHELVRVEKRPLQDVLCKGLKLTDPHAQQNCALLMAEPPHVSDLRDELQGRLERLRAAQTELIGV